MEYLKENNVYLVRIDRGEDLMSSLSNLAIEEQLQSGSVTGIGALEKIKLGFYHLDTKTYDSKVFEGEYELLSLSGNLSFMENAPFFHLHAQLSGADYSCIGGPLFEATVAVTCEIYLTCNNFAPTRTLDSEVGLNTLSFK